MQIKLATTGARSGERRSARRFPLYAAYQQRTRRLIPLFVLTLVE